MFVCLNNYNKCISSRYHFTLRVKFNITESIEYALPINLTTAVAIEADGIYCIQNSNKTAFFRFVNKRAIYRLGIISLDMRRRKCTLCATLSASININYRLPIKVCYRICTLRYIRIEITHGNQNVFLVLTLVGGQG